MSTSERQPPNSGAVLREGSALRRAMLDPEAFPLGLYEASLSESKVSRMWNGVFEERQTRAVWPRVAVAVALSAVLSALLFWVRLPDPLELATNDEIRIGEVLRARQAERLLSFDDGSEIVLGDEGELSVLSNEGQSFVTALRKGTARFSVKPGGPRRWLVDAGEISVEVVGTVFTVERDERGATVSVERGKVRVTGNVPGGSVLLTAGKSISSAPKTVASRRDEATPEVREKKEATEPREAASESEDGVTLAELEQEAETKERKEAESTGEDSAGGVVRRVDTATLLARADEAKQKGDLRRAAALFLQVVQRSGASDPRRGIAAMSYVRIVGDPSQVTQVLSSSMGAMPGGLRQSAWLRLIRAFEQEGNVNAARDAARAYLVEFPSGSRRDEVRHLTTPQ